MTSASELFYTRRSRVGRSDPDPGIGSSIDRNYNRRHHLSHHNHRHDLDGCDNLRRSSHLRHVTPRASAPSERASMRFDQGSSQFVSTNGLNPDGVSSSSRQSLSSNERLPGAVLLARARLLERLRGVSVSANRPSSRAPPSTYQREYLLGDDLRLVDSGDWGSEISTGQSAGSSPFSDLTSQTERFQILQETNKKPPGLTQEVLDSLPHEVFSSGDVDDERKLSRESRDCSICLDSFRDEDAHTRLPCGHRFHLACLDPWVRTCGDCPYCRRSIL
ncbi:probable E3 ubiquitin-protein ligase RHY1A [Durio zibethinus]|uniref:Probable E3 ubiquitin-protein ligase RHY1A n=1 Tax=Durio zibethinus TaxID=66656 RepID=A0A6P5YZC9_DURZI|nr:probable E3 ubiquitin-protein ligase RHY1A [Durio zibethinus]XP_022745447.1 probable E3 ubiquitin-protein ligase RHY1A [Durio zibethinus]